MVLLPVWNGSMAGVLGLHSVRSNHPHFTTSGGYIRAPGDVCRGLPILCYGIGVGLALGIIFGGVKVLAKSGIPSCRSIQRRPDLLGGRLPNRVLPGWLRPVFDLIPPHVCHCRPSKGSDARWRRVTGDGARRGHRYPFGHQRRRCFHWRLWVYSRAIEYGRKLGVLDGY